MAGSTRIRAAKVLIALGAIGAVLAAASPAAAQPQPDDRQDRILGGSAASINDAPYMAGVFFKGRYGCAGSIIGPRHVLTAAHCIIGPASQYSVVTGRTNLADSSSGEVLPVIQTFVSPDYREGRGKIRGHDLAVLALASPTLAPVAAVATEAEGFPAIVPGGVLATTGWGATTPFQKGISIAQLRLTYTRTVAQNRCKPYRKAYVRGTMVCTSGPKLNPGKRSLRTSPCAGDSGGPLASATATGPRVVGVVSYGPRLCGLPFQPVVYARTFTTIARAFIGQALVTPLP